MAFRPIESSKPVTASQLKLKLAELIPDVCNKCVTVQDFGSEKAAPGKGRSRHRPSRWAYKKDRRRRRSPGGIAGPGQYSAGGKRRNREEEATAPCFLPLSAQQRRLSNDAPAAYGPSLAAFAGQVTTKSRYEPLTEMSCGT
jgi:hypothetical protein